MVFFQKRSGEKFSEKNQQHIERTTQYNVHMLCFAEQRGKKRSRTVDWKHPIRCFTKDVFVFFEERVQSRPEAFETPTAQPAGTEIFNQLFHKIPPSIVFYSIPAFVCIMHWFGIVLGIWWDVSGNL